jgi:hypothetical protein
MTATWTVTTANDTAMTAYIAMRLAQDRATVTLDQAIAELLLIAGVNQAGTISGPTIKKHGGKF